MSDILCRWLNEELRLSKSIDPRSLSKEFSNGYLIGEVLHKYKLQEDFERFLKSNTESSKLNNFIRVGPTLQLLGISFNLRMAQSVMQEQPGAASHLLYQLYVLLQKKKRRGLSVTAIEAMQPSATASFHRLENDIYSERLRTLVKREADVKLQKIALNFEVKGQEVYDKSVMVKVGEEQKRKKVQAEMRLQDMEKHRQARKKQHEIIIGIQAATIQIPKPPPKRTLKHLERQQQNRRKREAEKVRLEIAEFENNRKMLLPAGGFGPSNLSADQINSFSSQRPHLQKAEELAQANNEYLQQIHQRLHKDAEARQQREKRRRLFLVEQLKAHEAQQDALREQQLVERLSRQSQQEKRLAVQLMLLHKQKDVIRQNRLFCEKQYQERREKDFQEALEKEAAEAHQARLDHAEEIQKEIELHDKLAAERKQASYQKHFDNCRHILEQMVDLAMKVGEYRLLTDNLIPWKLMQEWKQVFLSGKSLYDSGSLEDVTGDPTPEQKDDLEKQEILNDRDYDEYTSMTGEWAWPEEAEAKPPPSKNNLLGHAVLRMQTMVNPHKPVTPPPMFPLFTLKACVLGKVFSGKSTSLAKVAQEKNIHILAVGDLVQEALAACQLGKQGHECTEGGETSTPKDIDQLEKEDGDELSENSEKLTAQLLQQATKKTSERPLKAQLGAAAENLLRKGCIVPDELLVDIVVEAIRAIPGDSGWVLDGFPGNINQAKLLEKALGGLDPEERMKSNRRANLLTDTNPHPETPLAPPALDLVVLLDVSDEEVIRRAVKQPCEERSSGKSNSGPPEMTSELASDLVSDLAVVSDGDQIFEKRQVQHRIAAFQETWPKLEKWFSGKHNILVKLNAELSEELLCRKLESILGEAMVQSENVEEVVLDSEQTAEASVIQVASPVSASQSITSLQDESLTPGVKPSTPHSPKGEDTKFTMLSSFDNNHGGNTGASSTASMPDSTTWTYVDQPLPKEIPEYLVPYWDIVCNSYVTNVKVVMQKLRKEHVLIIHHLFNIREEFKQFLQRPDMKQEFVSQWQTDYNNIPEDIREDEETKAELYQRLDDLRERLWDMCDKRKGEALQERTSFTSDGWLHDHTARVINHFATLMQVEVDRFQNTVCILRDYYKGMYLPVLPDQGSEFTCIPLLDIVEPGTLRDHTMSSERVTQSATERDNEQDEKNINILRPLIPRRPPSTDMASTNQNDLHDLDEKILKDIYETALTAVNNMVSVEAAQREVEENEEAQRKIGVEGLQSLSQASAYKASSTKVMKKAGVKNKGPPPPVEEPSPLPPTEEDPEEVYKRSIRTRIRQEYAAALEHEEGAVRVRLELVQSRALCMVKGLHKRAEQVFLTMEEWLDARFLAEMTSIDQLSSLVCQHIESATKLHSKLILVDTDFFLNDDDVLVTNPPPCTPHLVPPSENTFNILQLEAFYQQLRKMAPTGVLYKDDFLKILQSLTSGANTLPDLWMYTSETQLVELVSLLTQDSDMLDWRRFLLSASLPWPTLTLAQLQQVLDQFKMADAQATGTLTEEQYLQVDLWSHSEPAMALPMPDHRLANLRKFFFMLFADPDSSPACVDYVTMLLYLAAHPDPEQGFIRALSVVMGQPLPLPTSRRLLQSLPCMEEGVSESTEVEEEVEEESQRGARSVEGVTITALLIVICHGGAGVTSQNHIQSKGRSSEEYKQDFEKVYRELGYEVDDQIPFSILSEHPFIQKLIESSTKYQLIDIHKVLQVQRSEEEPLSLAAS
ncbi:hypothetical protein UPYG_G00190380 [Umbra pygmaea]|uniref:Calponin-homology (CH) domain-containing protein n=1 Tax=Umbra pygmaea TaxID=75934 RepID=A0ABD0XDK9_UMBPY